MSDDVQYSDDDFQEEKSPPKTNGNLKGSPAADPAAPAPSAEVEYEDDYDEPDTTPLDEGFDDDHEEDATVQADADKLASPDDLYDADEFADTPPSVLESSPLIAATPTALEESYGDNEFTQSIGADLPAMLIAASVVVPEQAIDDSYNDHDFAAAGVGDFQIEATPDQPPIEPESASSPKDDEPEETNATESFEREAVADEDATTTSASPDVTIDSSDVAQSTIDAESKKEDDALPQVVCASADIPSDDAAVEFEGTVEDCAVAPDIVATENDRQSVEAVDNPKDSGTPGEEQARLAEPAASVELDTDAKPSPDESIADDTKHNPNSVASEIVLNDDTTTLESPTPTADDKSEQDCRPPSNDSGTPDDGDEVDRETNAVLSTDSDPTVVSSSTEEAPTHDAVSNDDNGPDTLPDSSLLTSTTEKTEVALDNVIDAKEEAAVDTERAPTAAATVLTSDTVVDQTTDAADSSSSPTPNVTSPVLTTSFDIGDNPTSEIESTGLTAAEQEPSNDSYEPTPESSVARAEATASTEVDASATTDVSSSVPSIVAAAELADAELVQQDDSTIPPPNATNAPATIEPADPVGLNESVPLEPSPAAQQNEPDYVADFDADSGAVTKDEAAAPSSATVPVESSAPKDAPRATGPPEDEPTSLGDPPPHNADIAYAHKSVFDEDEYMGGGAALSEPNNDTLCEAEAFKEPPLAQDTPDPSLENRPHRDPSTVVEPLTSDRSFEHADNVSGARQDVEPAKNTVEPSIVPQQPALVKKESKLKTRLPPKQSPPPSSQPAPCPPKPRPPPQARKPETTQASPSIDGVQDATPPLDTSRGMEFHSPQKDYRPWRQDGKPPSPAKPRGAPKKKKVSPPPPAATSPPKFHFDPKVDKMKEEWLLLNMFRQGDASKYEEFCTVHKPVVSPTPTTRHHRPSSADRGNYHSHSARRLVVPPKRKQELHALQARERNWVVDGSVKHNTIPAYDSILDKYCHTITSPLVQKQIYNSVDLSPQLAYVLEKRVQATRQAEVAFLTDDHTYAKTYKPKATDTPRAPTKPSPRQPLNSTTLASDIVSLKWSTAKLKSGNV